MALDLIKMNYNPDVLSCLANLSNDEVFTPPEVVNQMLDMLPQELFCNPDTTFLDPATKSGVFLREIAKRLMRGLERQIPDLQERVDHIFKKQLFGIAMTELTSLLTRRSLYCSKYPNSSFSITKFETPEGNIRFRRINHAWKDGRCTFCGASQSEYDRSDDLETHAYEWIHSNNPKELWNMKFDVIISNPPYQLSDGGQKASATPIYQKFVQHAKRLNPRYVTMIIPARWYSGGRGLDDFREEMLTDKRVRNLVDFTDANDCFPGVDIAGGVCYFLWDRDHEGLCRVKSIHNGIETETDRQLDEFDVFIRHSEALSIIEKINSKHEPMYNTRVSSQKPFGLRTYVNAINESWLPITTSYYLYLSGTPFRAINSGEFIEEQIFNWTYSDEQKAKAEWVGSGNPYAALPRMIMMTYRIPDSIRRVAQEGEFDEFDLNLFFSADFPKGHVEEAKFKYENEVQKWLDLMRGSYLPSSKDEMKVGEKPPMPYSDARLLSVLQHTLWFLPNVASCYAMANLLAERQNTFYHDYKVIVCAGIKAGIGLDALYPVEAAMSNPLETKTITLSCGKLTTGVTVRPWSGVFMLRNLKSPETYFQTAFRVQSPWTVKDEAGDAVIMKQDCYVFDFALDRALHQIADYACQLNTKDSDPEANVGEFIKFLPVLAYDGAKMTNISAEDILDFTTAGTSATLLAKRWESALLVNVDNETLNRLLNNPEALAALMKIEGFRSLNADIQTIINKSEAIKKAKKEKGDKLTPKEKKELTEQEKELKSKRKQIQEKLIKFATRVPVFMYLSEYREKCLKDVITLLEPKLFKLTTGLDVKDFDLLCSLNVFNGETMNQAIWQFKRYEDASLGYTGINRHDAEENVGGWDTVIRKEEFEAMFTAQQKSMAAPKPTPQVFVNQPVTTVPTQKPQTSPAKPSTSAGTPIRPAPQPVVPRQPIQHIPIRPTINTPATQQKVHVDVSGVGPGTPVIHKSPTLGEGVVVKIDQAKKYIHIKFAGGVKMFTFPDCFDNGFVKLK